MRVTDNGKNMTLAKGGWELLMKGSEAVLRVYWAREWVNNCTIALSKLTNSFHNTVHDVVQVHWVSYTKQLGGWPRSYWITLCKCMWELGAKCLGGFKTDNYWDSICERDPSSGNPAQLLRGVLKFGAAFVSCELSITFPFNTFSKKWPGCVCKWDLNACNISTLVQAYFSTPYFVPLPSQLLGQYFYDLNLPCMWLGQTYATILVWKELFGIWARDYQCFSRTDLGQVSFQ